MNNSLDLKQQILDDYLYNFFYISQHSFTSCTTTTRKHLQKNIVNVPRRRWNRTTEHISSPTDLKSALHTNEGHPRIYLKSLIDLFVDIFLQF